MTKATKTSQRKAEANRRNASKSTGPRTAKGKSWSRLNALKHGILASQVVISTIEGYAERKLFEATVEGLAQDFQPVGTYEELLVQEIATCFWRKRRLNMFENRAACDAIEIPANQLVNNPSGKPRPWKEPFYMAGDKLTTAEHIYKDAGLDGITLPNEADTMRVIRYDAAITRTRERAVRSLREMRSARRGEANPRAEVAPAIDRAAARRNASRAKTQMMPPYVSAQIWNQIGEIWEEAAVAKEQASGGPREGGEVENDQTKPKTLSVEEVRRQLYRSINGCEMPEEPATEPSKPKDDPDKPPST